MFFYIPIYRVSQITRGPSLQCTWCPRNTPVYMVSQEHSSVHGVPETLQCTWCPKTLQCTLCPRNTPVYIVSQKHSSVHGVPETLQCTWCPKNTPVYIVSQKHDSFHNVRYKFATYSSTKQLCSRKTLFKQSYFLFTLLGFQGASRPSSISILIMAQSVNIFSLLKQFHQFREIGLLQQNPTKKIEQSLQMQFNILFQSDVEDL